MTKFTIIAMPVAIINEIILLFVILNVNVLTSVLTPILISTHNIYFKANTIVIFS